MENLKNALGLRLGKTLFYTSFALGCSDPGGEEPTPPNTSATTSTDALSNGTATGQASTASTASTTSIASTTSQSGTTTATTSTSSVSSSTATGSTTDDTSTTSTDSGSVPVPTFYEVQTILQQSCVFISCHTPAYNMPTLNDFDGMLHDRMLTYQVSHCNAVFVKPGEPENSAILKVVTHGCGDFIMPPLCEDPCMDPYSYASLEAWIKAGAPSD